MLMILGQGKGGITEAVRWLFDEHQLLTASLIIGSILYAITWPWRMLRLMKKHDPGLLLYSKQVIYASLVMGTFFALIGLLVIIATFVDNRIGEQARFLMGMLTTPFIMETLLVTLGASLVIIFNHYRLKHQGDEYVSLEIPDTSQNRKPDQPSEK